MPYDMLWQGQDNMAFRIEYWGLITPVLLEPSPVKSTAHDRFSHIVARLGDGA